MTPQPRTPVVAFAVVFVLLAVAGLWWSGLFLSPGALAPSASDATAVLQQEQATNAADAATTPLENANAAAARIEAVPANDASANVGSLLCVGGAHCEVMRTNRATT